MPRALVLSALLLIAACARDVPTASEPIDEPPPTPPVTGGGPVGGGGAPPLSCPAGNRCFTVNVAARDAYTETPILGAQVSIVSLPGGSTYISQTFPVDEHGNFTTGETIPEGTPIEVTVSAPTYQPSAPSKAFWNANTTTMLVSDTLTVAGMRGLVTASIRSPATGVCMPAAVLEGKVSLFPSGADPSLDLPIRTQRLSTSGSYALFDLPPAEYQVVLQTEDGFRTVSTRRAERGRTAFAPFSIPCQ
jgi:hypothetical protein